jgi:hypothetical protein
MNDYENYINSVAKKLSESPNFRWVGGMLAIGSSSPTGSRLRFRITNEPVSIGRDNYPVITDAATAGCLLKLIREIYSDPTATLTCNDILHQRQWICSGVENTYSRAASEAEALAFALLGAQAEHVEPTEDDSSYDDTPGPMPGRNGFPF